MPDPHHFPDCRPPRRRAARRLVLILGVAAIALIALPRQSFALFGLPRLIASIEYGQAKFSDLTSFTLFLQGGGGRPDAGIEYNYRFEDAPARGFRVGLELHRSLDLTFSRSFVETRYQVFRDGIEVPPGTDGSPPLLPNVEIRFDSIALGWRPNALRFGNFAPLFRLGYGWIRLSPDGELRPPDFPPLEPPNDYSTVEASAGLQWQWKLLDAGAELRSFHWKWDAMDRFIPVKTTHTWMLSVWVGVRL